MHAFHLIAITMREVNEEPAALSASKLGAANSTADRAIDILLMFSEEHPILSAAEIAAHFDMPRSTTYRYINSLRSYALIVEDDGGYRLGPKIFPLARTAKASTSIVKIAAPHLKKLNALFGEAVSLYQRIGQEIVALDQLESRHPVTIAHPRGQMLPWPGTAGAKVLLAFATQTEQTALFRLMKPIRYTKRTITSLKTLREALAKIRRDGFAFSDQERDEGVRAIAAPIFSGGEGCYCVTLSGLSFRLTDERLPEMIAEVKVTTSRISEDLCTIEY